MLKIEMPKPTPLNKIPEGEKYLKPYQFGINRWKRPKKTKGARKKAVIKCVPFERTPVGVLLKYCAPLEFSLIMDSCTVVQTYVIESVAYASNNDLFKTERFRLALGHYKKYGCQASKNKDMDVNDAMDFAMKRVNGLV